MLIPGGITPHFLEPVKSPCFRQHDMNNDINIVNYDPLQGLDTFMPVRTFSTFIFYFHLYEIGNGFDLRVAACFANNKEVCNCFMNFPKVK